MRKILKSNFLLYSLNFIIWTIAHGTTFILALLVYASINGETSLKLLFLVGLIKVIFIYIGAQTDYAFKIKIQERLYHGIRSCVATNNMHISKYSESLNSDPEVISYFYMTLIDTAVNIITILFMIISLIIIEKFAALIIVLQVITIVITTNVLKKSLRKSNELKIELENKLSYECLNSTYKTSKYFYDKNHINSIYSKLRIVTKKNSLLKLSFKFVSKYSTLFSLLTLYILNIAFSLEIHISVFVLVALYFSNFLEFSAYVSNIIITYHNYIASVSRLSAIFGNSVFDLHVQNSSTHQDLLQPLQCKMNVVVGKSGSGKSRYIAKNFLYRKDIIVINNNSKLFNGTVEDNLCENYSIDSETINSLGIKEQLNTSVKNLSGGEAVRALILRALSYNPSTIVIDGVLNSIDVNNIDKLLTLLENCNSNVVIVSSSKIFLDRGYNVIEI